MICIGFSHYFPLFFFFESNLLLLDYHMYYMTPTTTEFFQINNIYIRLWLWWNVDVWSDVNVYVYGDIATISYLLHNLVCFGDKNTNFNFNSVSLRKREKKSNVLLLIKLNYTNKPTTKALMFTIKKKYTQPKTKEPNRTEQKMKDEHTQKHDYKKTTRRHE